MGTGEAWRDRDVASRFASERAAIVPESRAQIDVLLHVLILVPVDRQCAWLREIGFADVDVFWKWFELALFGGRKPCS